MKLIATVAATALVAAGAVAVLDTAPAGAVTPYDFCTRTAPDANGREVVSCSFVKPGVPTSLLIPHIAQRITFSGIGGHGWDPNGSTPSVAASVQLSDTDLFVGHQVTVTVGGNGDGHVGGANGGGDGGADPDGFSGAGGGGGASEIRLNGQRVFVVPGSGGAGGYGYDGTEMVSGGSGGHNDAPGGMGDDGTPALDSFPVVGGSGGGSGSEGGGGGAGGYDSANPSTASYGDDGTSTGAGGKGGWGYPDVNNPPCPFYSSGGGGGGGYVGGGGGGAGGQSSDGQHCAGGGGGAGGSFGLPRGIPTITDNVTDDPIITISWTQTFNATFTNVPNGAVGQSYSASVGTTDTPGSKFLVVSGATPPGLVLSPSGVLNGTPNTVGSYGFTVAAMDADGAAQRTGTFSMSITQAAVAFTNAPPNATKGKAYSFQFTASNCAGCVFSRVAGQGGLPHGLSLSSAGKLSGTPTTIENASFVIQASSSDGRSTQQRFPMKVLAAPALAVNDVSVTESSGVATFTITLNPAASGTVTVHYATANGTAVAPGDYTAVSGTATFTAGQTTKTITVPIKNDTTHEGAETFRLVLSAPSGATIADSSGTATIAASD